MDEPSFSASPRSKSVKGIMRGERQKLDPSQEKNLAEDDLGLKTQTPRIANRRKKSSTLNTYLGPSDAIGDGDSRIVYGLDLPSDAFEKIRDEVAWQKMYHLSGEVPRLVAVQGLCNVDDESVPIYRHPADEAPPLRSFTPTVNRVRAVVERILGHQLNHALIQLYRGGEDRITEHSDKTLDIVRGSFICNVSLGAQRVMVLRTKASTANNSTVAEGNPGRQTQRVPLPHESLFILGEKTNMHWLHGIRPDRRAGSEKSLEERAYDGVRISITFRHIGTFTDPVAGTIWGQGACHKSREQAGKVIHGDTDETQRMIRAFGEENHATDFDWDAVYGKGFDVVNFVTASTAKLVMGGDPTSNLRVRLCLEESGQRYDLTDSTATELDASQHNAYEDGERPLYIDPEDQVVAGDINILTHLAQRPSKNPGADSLHGGAQLVRGQKFLKERRDYQAVGQKGELDIFLDYWEQVLSSHGHPYLNGSAFEADDCCLWPVLREIEQKTGQISGTSRPNLQRYYGRVGNRKCVKAVLGQMNG